MFALLPGMGVFRQLQYATGSVIPPLINLSSTFFDGTNEFVDLGTPSDLTINLANQEFVISAWINVSDVSANHYIVAKARPFVPNIGYIFGVGTSGQLFGYYGGLVNTATANRNDFSK